MPCDGDSSGAGVSGEGDTLAGASLGGLIGYGGGVVAAGALSAGYRPSWYAQKWMWIGFTGGVAATSIVYVAYLATEDCPFTGVTGSSVMRR